MKYLIVMLLTMLPLIQPCHAVEYIEELYPKSEIEQSKAILPEDIRSMVDTYDIISGQGLQTALNELKSYIINNIEAGLKDVWGPVVSIFAVIILCSLFDPLFPSDRKSFPLLLFGSVEILYLSLSNAQTFFSEGIKSIERLYDFSTVLLPCLAGTSVAAGATVSAGVKYTAAALFMNILLNFSNTILIPMISVYLTCVIGGTVFEQRILSVLADLIRWGSKTVLTWCTVIFTAYLNIAGLITATGDLFATRITKSALAGILPVVGNIISNTASSLVAGAAILRNSIGIFGLLSIVGILLFPFMKLGIRYLLFLAVGRLANLFPNRKFSDLLGGIAGAFGMLLGVIGTGFVMIFLTLISFMQIVGG